MDDVVDDDDQTCTVRLNPASVPAGGDTRYHALADVDVSVTVTDDDSQPTLVLTPSSISENGGVSTVTATLAPAATSPVTITVSMRRR